MKSGLILAMLLGLVASLASEASAEDPPKKTCFKLAKIDSPASHPDTNEGKSYIATHDDVINPDGTIRSTIKPGNRYAGSIWTINPKAGTASYKQLDPAGSAEVSFTPLPEYLCPDDHFTFNVDVKNQGGADCGVWWYGEAESWKDVTTTGTNPFDQYKLGSGSFTGRFAPANTREGIKIQLRMKDGGYGAWAEYHYEPTNETAPPRQPQPPRVQKCPDTFERDWVKTNWGRFVIHVSGTTASGEYSNRDGKFGPGTMVGTVNGHQLEGTWKDANGAGTISLTLSDDACTWAGWHTVNPDTTKQQGPISQPNPPKSGPGGDPCTDPGMNDCIDKWIKLATDLRNKYDTSDPGPNGPWRLNEYGIWVGHVVKEAGKHVNWETVYHSNKYCYVWMEFQTEHEFFKYYHGELPPLATFVTDCHSSMPPQPPPIDPPVVSRMTLVAYKRKVQAGETVQVPIWLLKGADVANMNFTVSYDPNVATVTGNLTGGYLLDGALFDSNIKTSGLIQVGFARTSGISGDGPVAYADFKAVGKPGDRTPLTLAVTTINNTGGSVPAIDLINGEILIVGPSGVIPGDCDGDGVLTAADAWCALQMSVNNIPVKMVMDMDGDGKVTSRDSTLILQKAVGK